MRDKQQISLNEVLRDAKELLTSLHGGEVPTSLDEPRLDRIDALAHTLLAQTTKVREVLDNCQNVAASFIVEEAAKIVDNRDELHKWLEDAEVVSILQILQSANGVCLQRSAIYAAGYTEVVADSTDSGRDERFKLRMNKLITLGLVEKVGRALYRIVEVVPTGDQELSTDQQCEVDSNAKPKVVKKKNDEVAVRDEHTLRAIDMYLNRQKLKQNWFQDGECADMDPNIFFSDDIKETENAYSACGQCAVRAECLADALRIRNIGIRGGMSENQRRKLKKELKALPIGAEADS